MPPHAPDPNFVAASDSSGRAAGRQADGSDRSGNGPTDDDIDQMPEAQLRQLRPIDCHGREVPREHYEWKGVLDCGYVRELYRNPQYYEVFECDGWAALRCRLCTSARMIDTTHTPESRKHVNRTGGNLVRLTVFPALVAVVSS